MSESLVLWLLGVAGMIEAALLTWAWRISARHAKHEMEHEALEERQKKNEQGIADAHRTLEEVRSMMLEERRQMSKMASKIDLLISVLVSRSDASVDLKQIMAILEKGDK